MQGSINITPGISQRTIVVGLHPMCLPSVYWFHNHDHISWAFPLHTCKLKWSKTRGGGGLGMRLCQRLTSTPSLILLQTSLTVIQKQQTTES